MEKLKEFVKKPKMLVILIIIILLLVLVIYGSFIGINKIIYNVSLNNCYTLIKENKTNEVIDILSKYEDKEPNLSSDVINKIYLIIEENKESIKTGNNNSLLETLSSLKKYLNNDELSKNVDNIEIYIEAINYINENNYTDAYLTLNKATEIYDTDIYNQCKNKLKEIEANTFNKVLEKSNEYISGNDYLSAQNLLFDFKDFGNTEITDLYNSVSKHIEIENAISKANEYMASKNYSKVMETLKNLLNENNDQINTLYNTAKTEKERIDAEEKAKKEAEEKARAKAEAERKAKEQKQTTTYFTNKYGTSTTKCHHSGCNKYIASSGDTNCCTTHSRRCGKCHCYIDEDASYCMDCIKKALYN